MILGPIIIEGLVSSEDYNRLVKADMKEPKSLRSAINILKNIVDGQTYEPHSVYGLQGACLKIDDYISDYWNEKLNKLLSGHPKYNELRNIVSSLPLFYSAKNPKGLFSFIDNALVNAEDSLSEVKEATQVLDALKNNVNTILSVNGFGNLSKLQDTYEKHKEEVEPEKRSQDEKIYYGSTFGQEAVVQTEEVDVDVDPTYQLENRLKRRMDAISRIKITGHKDYRIQDFLETYNPFLNDLTERLKSEDLRGDVASARIVNSAIGFFDSQARGYWKRLLDRIDKELPSLTPTMIKLRGRDLYGKLSSLPITFSHLARATDKEGVAGALVEKIDALLHNALESDKKISKQELADDIHNLILDARFTDKVGKEIGYEGGLTNLRETYYNERTKQFFKNFLSDPNTKEQIKGAIQKKLNDIVQTFARLSDEGIPLTPGMEDVFDIAKKADKIISAEQSSGGTSQGRIDAIKNFKLIEKQLIGKDALTNIIKKGDSFSMWDSLELKNHLRYLVGIGLIRSDIITQGKLTPEEKALKMEANNKLES